MSPDEVTDLLDWSERAQLGQARGMSAMRALRADQVQDLCRAWLIVHAGQTEAGQMVKWIKRRRGEAAL